MNNPARIALAAAAVVVVAVVGYNLLPGRGGIGGRPTPEPTILASPSPAPEATLPPGTYLGIPFSPLRPDGMCPPAIVDATCVEDPRDDTITFRYEVPEPWERLEPVGAWIDENAPPDGAAVTVGRGNWLYSDPCVPDDNLNPDIPVGPTVDDLVTALVDHPLLDVTTPVDVTLAGYSGKYLDLQVPDDISECFRYRPIDVHIYAQGPGHRWHMWVLDVGGVRVLIEGNDYAGTSAARLAEEQTIIDSIEITP